MPRGSGNLTVASNRAARFGTRLKHGLTFVAIVWGVAASFIAFEVLSLRGMDVMLSYPEVFRSLLLSQATKHSTACVVPPGASSAAGNLGEGRFGAWALGLRVGRDSLARQWSTVTPEVLAESAAGVRQVAGILGVAAPQAFSPKQLANANDEFLTFVELDAAGTAHQLALKHASSACQLYKLGALWGYSSLTRAGLRGERPVFAVEIRYYGQRAGLPESLWQPMTARTRQDVSNDQLMSDTQALTDAMTNALMRGSRDR